MKTSLPFDLIGVIVIRKYVVFICICVMMMCIISCKFPHTNSISNDLELSNQNHIENNGGDIGNYESNRNSASNRRFR